MRTCLHAGAGCHRPWLATRGADPLPDHQCPTACVGRVRANPCPSAVVSVALGVGTGTPVPAQRRGAQVPAATSVGCWCPALYKVPSHGRLRFPPDGPTRVLPVLCRSPDTDPPRNYEHYRFTANSMIEGMPKKRQPITVKK